MSAPSEKVKASTPVAPFLPTEIISNIVRGTRQGNASWTADIRNLSLVSSDFLGPCQEVLFNFIMIGPPSYTAEGVREEGIDLAARFSDLIAHSPGLGRYVRGLRYRLPHTGHPKHYATEATQALNSCTQVRTFSIEWEQLSEGKQKYFDWDPQDLIGSGAVQGSYQGLLSAFAKLLASKSLVAFSLLNVRVPAYLITGASALEILNLQGAAHCAKMPDDATEAPIMLKHFILAGDAPYHTGDVWKTGGPYPIGFSNLLTLNTAFGCHNSEAANEQILSQASCLRRFWLHTADARRLKARGNAFEYKDPLRHLHSHSYTTLTSLNLEIKFDIDRATDVISDPWQGLCNQHDTGSSLNTLRKLKELSYLVIKIWIGGRAWRTMDYYDNFANPEWQQLDRALLPGGSEKPFVYHPKLKYLGLLIGLELEASTDCQASESVDPRTDEEMRYFRRNVLARAELLPWMGNLMKKVERKELEADFGTTIK